jgi:LPXTG-site transpeptidase (sortase) family protein
VRQFRAIKWRLLPLVLAAVIICIPFINGALSRHSVNQVAQAAQVRLDKSGPKVSIQGVPDRILIPSLAINLPVVSQAYSQVTKTWPVVPGVANYATNSALINNIKAESLIYGHDTRNVFGPLNNLKPGDTVFVYTANGHVFKYSYASSQDVTPTKLSIFDDMAKAPAGLKLITCSGAYFQYRHLMSLKLVQAS